MLWYFLQGMVCAEVGEVQTLSAKDSRTACFLFWLITVKTRAIDLRTTLLLDHKHTTPPLNEYYITTKQSQIFKRPLFRVNMKQHGNGYD